jgi:hypothetical protein
MKEKLKDNKYILLVGICLITIGFGLADCDYYWQAYSGKNIVQHLNFYSIKDLVWGTEDLDTYLDHEWLTNIIFYIFSLLGTKGIFFLKTTICLCVSLSIVKFVKHYNKDIQGIPYILMLIVLFLASMLVFKVKAYTISIIFVMYEIRLLEEYKKDNSNYKVFIIKIIALTLLWNNMHSGSVPLLYVIAGLYWLAYCVKDLKFLGLGLISLVCLGINPYGYKLIYFDITHNFDKDMKYIVRDWKCIDFKDADGKLAVFIMLVFIIALFNQRSKPNKFYVLYTLLAIFLTLNSERHIIYLLPILLILLCNIQSNYNIKLNYNYCNMFIIGLLLVITINTLQSKTYDVDYCMMYLDDEILDILETYGDEGLFSNDQFQLPYGYRVFYTGAYPLNKNRTDTSYYMINYADSISISNIISNYGMTKFLITRYNKDMGSYVFNNSLYSYLSQSDDYICLYSSDILCFYIDKKII